MLQKSAIILSLILSAAWFGLSAAAQTSEETFPVRDSKLAAIDLPAGALQIREASVPAEIKLTLAKLVAAGGDKIRQGGSEVLIWSGGGYKKSNSAQLTKKLETALRNSGWTYEVGERNDEFVLFSLFREEPSRRALVGFFVPSDDAYIFALTEMARADSPIAETENPAEEKSPKNNNGISVAGSGNPQSIVGRWSRGEGSGFIDHTGKTQYKSGRTYSFEFFPDGTIEYTVEVDVLSILQCRTKSTDKARGKVILNGDTMTINLAAGTSVGISSCETKDNFKKILPASSVTVKFKVKKMDSITRPDNPMILCFDGKSDEACFERVNQ